MNYKNVSSKIFSSGRKRWTASIILLLLVLGLLGVSYLYLDRKGTINERQAKLIAYGYAAQDCFAAQYSNCKDLKPDSMTYSKDDPLARNVAHWQFGYTAGVYPDNFNSTVIINRYGERVSVEDLN